MTWLRMKSAAFDFGAKNPAKRNAAFCFSLNKRGEQLLVSGKGLSVIASRPMQLASKDISRHHG